MFPCQRWTIAEPSLARDGRHGIGAGRGQGDNREDSNVENFGNKNAFPSKKTATLDSFYEKIGAI